MCRSPVSQDGRFWSRSSVVLISDGILFTEVLVSVLATVLAMVLGASWLCIECLILSAGDSGRSGRNSGAETFMERVLAIGVSNLSGVRSLSSTRVRRV